jgi:hypothetical protein
MSTNSVGIKKLLATARRDRILRSATENPSLVEQLLYTRNATQNVSDHNAVYSMVRLTIKDIIQAKREAVCEKLMDLLDPL